MAEPDPADGTRESPARPTHDPLKSTPIGAAGAAGDSLLQSDQIPERIGQFEIKMLLGEGACGRVYLGFDPELERQVAIKQPHRARLTAEFRERFLREAKATATIHHANVCPVYIVGTDGELPYIVMHYVPGGTLAGLLDPTALRCNFVRSS
jgi:serine/threonine protein kinase